MKNWNGQNFFWTFNFLKIIYDETDVHEIKATTLTCFSFIQNCRIITKLYQIKTLCPDYKKVSNECFLKNKKSMAKNIISEEIVLVTLWKIFHFPTFNYFTKLQISESILIQHDITTLRKNEISHLRLLNNK